MTIYRLLFVLEATSSKPLLEEGGRWTPVTGRLTCPSLVRCFSAPGCLGLAGRMLREEGLVCRTSSPGLESLSEGEGDQTLSYHKKDQ